MSLDGLSPADREAMIERFRRTGLRLDRDGRWWHEGAVVEHGGLARAFHRWIDRLDNGRYILRLDDVRYAYIDVDDAPFVVRTLRIEDGGARVVLTLSGEREEDLDPSTISVGADHALYCRVRQGFEARFLRGAQQVLGEHVVEEDGGRFALSLGGRRWPIAPR